MFRIAIKNLLFRPWQSILNILLMTIALAVLSVITYFNKTSNQYFTKNIKGVDMVLGAKGSPLQLVLSSVLFNDTPTGNIDFESAKKLLTHPTVTEWIPIALGDNYKNYKIVGSTPQYFRMHSLTLTEGKAFSAAFEVTIGAEIAEKLNLKPGDSFRSSHGIDQDHTHETPFKVVGILKKQNQVADRLIFCSIESVHRLHHSDEKQQITAIQVRFKSPMGLMILPRQINENSPFQAALPSIEINKVFDFIDTWLLAINILGLFLFILAALSIFISLNSAVHQREYEFVLLRSLGANRFQLFISLFFEILISISLSFTLGGILARTAVYFVENKILHFSNISFSTFFTYIYDWPYLVLSLVLGIIASGIPLIRVYKSNIPESLNRL